MEKRRYLAVLALVALFSFALGSGLWVLYPPDIEVDHLGRVTITVTPTSLADNHTPTTSNIMLKVAIISLFEGKQEYFQGSIRNKQMYCDLHGYDCHFITSISYNNDDVVWEKVKATIDRINAYDWIWVLDADAFIMDMSLSVEKLVSMPGFVAHGDKTSLVIAKDCSGLNAGSLFLKNSTYTQTMLQIWYGLRFSTEGKEGYREQDCLQLMLEHNIYGLQERTSLMPQRLFNAFAHSDCGSEYKDGDFVAHFVWISKEFIVPDVEAKFPGLFDYLPAEKKIRKKPTPPNSSEGDDASDAIPASD